MAASKQSQDGTLCVAIKTEQKDCVKKTQLDAAQLFLSIFRQPLLVLAVSRPIIRMHNRMYTTTGTSFR